MAIFCGVLIAIVIFAGLLGVTICVGKFIKFGMGPDDPDPTDQAGA